MHAIHMIKGDRPLFDRMLEMNRKAVNAEGRKAALYGAVAGAVCALPHYEPAEISETLRQLADSLDAAAHTVEHIA